MYRVSPASLARVSDIVRHGTAAVCTAEAPGTLAPLAIFTRSHRPSSHSTAALFTTAAQREIVKLQQQQDSSNTSSKPSWVKPLLSIGAAAATAAGAWVLWSDQPRTQAQADAATGSLSQAPPKTQAAVVSCFGGPLVSLLQGLNPMDSQLQSIVKTLVDDSGSLNPRDLLDSLWGLAMLGAKLHPDQLQQLGSVALSNLQQYTVYQAIVAAWAVIMLCGCSSSSSTVVAAAQLAATAWQQLLQCLKATRAEEYDEAAVLYLLHAAVQQAAAADAVSHQGEVRASLQEVLQQVDGLPRKIKSRVTAAYQEYVPFQGFIESPFLTILHIVKSLPSHIKALQQSATASQLSPAAAAAAGSPYSSVFGGFTTADADAAATVMADSGVLGKLRRELFYTWRSNELLDRHQTNLNQVAHVLNRKLMLPLKQPADVDVLLPSLRTVIFLDDDTSPLLKVAALQSSRRQHQQQQLDTSDPQLPFTPQYWSACHDALVTLMRNRFSAPPGGFASKTTEGIRAAKERCLEQRGFTVVHIGFSEVEKCTGVGVGQRPRNRPTDYSALEALLRSRLRL